MFSSQNKRPEHMLWFDSQTHCGGSSNCYFDSLESLAVASISPHHVMKTKVCFTVPVSQFVGGQMVCGSFILAEASMCAF